MAFCFSLPEFGNSPKLELFLDTKFIIFRNVENLPPKTHHKKIVKENIDSSRIMFVEMEISKLINYWTDMC